MKNKTTKTIACVIAGLTLSACVGSVNVPAGTGDSVKEGGAVKRSTAQLTFADLPARPNNNFDSIDDDSPTGSCVGSGSSNPVSFSNRRCFGEYPTNIDIAPLNDNNNGISTYAGSVSVSYYNTSYYVRDITENIDIIVNFDNKTLRYSGQVASNSFSINGSFTDRGIITGSVDFGDTGDLIGLIGQNEAIGVFSSGSTGIRFGGGFTVYRSE